ncbi:gluconokinase [Bacillus luteolus]|uniref:Gluconokinase n=1 Tax=Litchfieldia luteola TaxID=682179 RepID=A0ABR9QEG1_9BACI|nr:gluconokinase [Cytobacillus luteolus]MBE4906882.1 gluconokinase [Cytobacillus luteolus]MBP1940463.1 gluconokinase [Cytobacillus luteolus]
MSKTIVIGLDIGTTSVKAVAFTRNGVAIAEQEVEYPLHTPHPSWAEQDPLVIEKATIEVIRSLIDSHSIDTAQLFAIGLSSAMHSLICMDSNGEPLSPSITWADGRAAEQASRLRENGLHIYQATGTPIHPMSPLVKLIWMKENNYEPYKNADKFVSIKEFLLYRWFGSTVVDYAIASATGLFDLHKHQWNKDSLKLAGISEEKLFRPVPPTEVLTGIDRDIAMKAGLPFDIPFVIGASDGPLANLGIGAINPGEVAITIGTSGAIRQIVSSPKTDELQQTFCYSFTETHSLIGGPTNNGGIVFRWLRDTFGGNENYASLTALAEKVVPGSEGLIFLPYLNGERAPMWNSRVRGNLHGLSLRHGKEHIIRAGLEGVIYSVYHVGQALERLAGPPQKILASGGFARSSLWLQMLADVFNQEVEVPISHQSSAWGAAWLALKGIGEVSDLTSIKESIPMQGSFTPNADNHKVYAEMFAVYKELSDGLDEFYS